MNGERLAIILLFLAFLVSLHQYIFFGQWFESKDIHHEMFIAALVFAAIITVVVLRRGNRIKHEI